MQDGFTFFISWNYPEAALNTTFEIDEFLVESTIDTGRPLMPRMIMYTGPGNYTLTNIDISRVFAYVVNAQYTIYFTQLQLCIPDDSLENRFNVDGLKIAIADNEDNAKTNIIVMMYNFSIYRKKIVTINNFHIAVYHNSYYGAFSCGMHAQDELYITNSLFQQFSMTYVSIMYLV